MADRPWAGRCERLQRLEFVADDSWFAYCSYYWGSSQPGSTVIGKFHAGPTGCRSYLRLFTCPAWPTLAWEVMEWEFYIDRRIERFCSCGWAPYFTHARDCWIGFQLPPPPQKVPLFWAQIIPCLSNTAPGGGSGGTHTRSPPFPSPVFSFRLSFPFSAIKGVSFGSPVHKPGVSPSVCLVTPLTHLH